MSIASTNLQSLGFPKKIEEEIAPYIFPASNHIHGVLRDVIPQIPQSLDDESLKEKGFELVGRGQSVCVLTHKKIKGYVIKIPLGTYVPPKQGFKRVRAHTYANKYLNERNTKSFIVSKNWLFPTSCNPEESKNFQEFEKQKASLKNREGYYAKKKKGEALYRSFVVVEEHLTLLDKSKKADLLHELFTREMIADQEAFLLDIGECDIHFGNFEFTEKGELVYVDLVNWKKNEKKRFQNGIWGFSKLHFYISDPSAKQFWANRMSAFFAQTDDFVLFEGGIFTTQLEEAIRSLTTEESQKKLKIRMQAYFEKRFKELNERERDEKSKKIAAFIDCLALAMFYVFKRP